MSCYLTSDFALGCIDSTGGIKGVWVYGDSSELSITHATGSISAISGTGTWYRIDQIDETSRFDSNVSVNKQTNSMVSTQTLELFLPKLDAETNEVVSLLSKNPKTRVIVETNNGPETDATGYDGGEGRYFLMGMKRGAVMTTANGTTGTSFEDGSGFTITFEARETGDVAPEILAGVDITTLNGIGA